MPRHYMIPGGYEILIGTGMLIALTIESLIRPESAWTCMGVLLLRGFLKRGFAYKPKRGGFNVVKLPTQEASR